MGRPPRVPDASIVALIVELRAQHATLTGMQLRAELSRRHGTPGGVGRVYRLLRQVTAPASPATPAPPDASAYDVNLQSRLSRALERARLAEEREEAHQSRWASEVDALRIEVRAARFASQRLPILEATLQDRSRELAAAYHRIADLEDELLRRRI